MRDTRRFDEKSRTLNARTAGAVIVPIVVLVVAALFIVIRQPGREVPTGRGISSYGFDLAPLLLSRDRLIGTDNPKGGIAALDHPATLPATQVNPKVMLAGITKLVSADRVIGVEIGGEARAYPLWVMEVHEVCNDTLGGREIAVTYDPLCDSTVVFDRVVDEAMVDFGVSGILYNSNLLMYDRRSSKEDESLWSQLQFRAVSGRAAARQAKLEVLPCAVVTWEAWKARHPDCTVALPIETHRDEYSPNRYARYFADDRLRYDVQPLPPDGPRRLKTPIVAIQEDNGWRVMPAAEFGGGAAASGRPVVHAFWFAWYAMHPVSDPK